MIDYPLYEVEECESFAEFISIIKSKYDKRIAFKNKKEKWTYNNIYNCISKCVCEFRKYHIKNIVIHIKNSCYFFIAYFSAILSGRIAFLSDDKKIIGSDYLFITDELLESIINNSIYTKVDFKETCLSPEELCTVVCSSGTTNKIKGIKLSQKNLLSDTFAGMKMYEYKETDVYFNILPYTHLFGIVADLLGPLYSGGTICFSEESLDFFDNLSFFKPTNLNLPPVMVDLIHKVLVSSSNFEQATGGKLKKIMCAGAKMNDSVNVEFSKYGLRAYAAYGLTECSPCVSINRDYYYKSGSVGKILPCCKVKILDNQIVVKGNNVMLGYLYDEKLTKETIVDDWLYTGDLGYLDKDGFLFVTGRLSNMIVFEDGTKLMPESLENEICSIDFVEECLVSKINQNGRIFLSINIITETKNTELIKKRTIETCYLRGLAQRICEISFSNKILTKNKLGKFIRKDN